jgi:hypothetical protein
VGHDPVIMRLDCACLGVSFPIQRAAIHWLTINADRCTGCAQSRAVDARATIVLPALYTPCRMHIAMIAPADCASGRTLWADQRLADAAFL